MAAVNKASDMTLVYIYTRIVYHHHTFFMIQAFKEKHIVDKLHVFYFFSDSNS